MNKKIFSLLVLLLIVVTVTIGYRVITQTMNQHNQTSASNEPFTSDDIAGEITTSFLNEDQEIEIGEIV
jgi:hypothetical protein